jgi:phenylalanyl-tRNA synthetase beta chain
MKISISWLKELVDFDLPVDELASQLTDAGLEVASIAHAGREMEGVVVGEIVAVSKHPQADKLSVCQVVVGTENLQIVCGAPNVTEKSKVPVALIGTRLPAGIQIQKSTLRGVDSFGMICSEKELEVGEVEDGIMILDPDLKVGQPLSSALGLEDWILDIELTPNRSDCLSVIGVARDVAALCGTRLKKPEIKLKEKGPGSAKDQVEIEIQDPQACPRYTARVIEGIKIKESPFWLKRKLYSAGMRPINNVVDISNLVMLEWGHPLHAFDYHLFTPHGKKDERKVVVRRAKKGEKFVTLDEIERTLNQEVLLITDGRVPVAIGGIMGGLKSEVCPDTRTVLLESAYFDPRVIRRGRMFLGLSTESSQRFERGADPNGVVKAADRAAELLENLAEGKVQKGVVDCYPSPMHPVQITLRPNRVNQLLNTELSAQNIKEILTALEMEVKEDQNLDVRVPTFRPDLTREIDLIEEIARIYGYSNINTSLRASGSLITKIHQEDKLAMEVKHFLSANGCYEVITNNLVDPDLLAKIYPQSKQVAIQNPLSRDLSVLSTTLAYGLLGVVSRNKNHLEKNVRIFELAKIFSSGNGNDQLPEERIHLGIALSGARQPRHWEPEEVEVDLYDLKGIMEALFGYLKISFELRPGKSALLLPERSFHVYGGEGEIGILGEVSKEAQTAFGIKDRVFWAELDFDRIVDLVPQEIQLSALPKFPPVERDIAVVADEGLLSEAISAKIKELGGSLIEDVILFDVYKGKQVPTGKKSLAYSIRYLSREKTLTDEEVDEIHRKVISELREAFGVTLRE